MQDLNDKITGGDLTAAEWNQVPSEIQNIIEGLGQTLSSGDLNQLGKGVAGYVANGNYYTESGAADAYVLTTVGSKQSLTAYADGARFIFKVGNTNTGASTANVATLGVKNIFLDGAALTGGELVAGEEYELEFNLSGDRLDIVKRTLQIQDWVDGGGAADDKRIRFDVDGGAAKFLSLTDALATRIDNIIVMDLGDGKLGVGRVPTTYDFECGSIGTSGQQIEINEFGSGDRNAFIDFHTDDTNTDWGMRIIKSAGVDSVGSIGVKGTGGIHLTAQGVAPIKFFTSNLERGYWGASGGLVVGNPVGTDKGVGNINAQNGIYVDNILVSGTAVSGYVIGQTISIEDDVGGGGNFSAGAVIGASWESLGPTSSGADNIWAELDSVPSTAKYVIVKVFGSLNGSTNGDTYTLITYARKTGSAASVTTDNQVSNISFINRSGLSERARAFNTVYIPIDSSIRFDLWITESGTTPSSSLFIILVGWGE